jgi:hypothetical protein
MREEQAARVVFVLNGKEIRVVRSPEDSRHSDALIASSIASASVRSKYLSKTKESPFLKGRVRNLLLREARKGAALSH